MATRLVALLILTLMLVAGAAPIPAAAQDGQDAVFINTSAASDFPEWIAFRLEVESESIIEQVALYWHAADDPTLSAVFPEIEPDTVVQLEHEVDMTIDYLPPSVDIAYFWRVIDVDGHTTESPEQTLFYMDDGQKWREMTDGLVTVYWYAGDDDFAQAMLDGANGAIERLSARFDVVADQPVRVVIYGEEDDFNDALPPNSADWIGGQAHPELHLFVGLVEAGDESEGRRLIPHEVSHLILHQATENPFNGPPDWLDEGLAVYNQELEDSWMDGVLEDAVDEGRLIPVRALNASFPLDPDQALLSYAESRSIVQYIIEELGDERMADLVAIFRSEVSFDEAVEGALGMSIDELDAAWKAWLGYEGDDIAGAHSDTAAPAQTDNPADDTDLSSNELAVLIGISGCFSLGGLILLIVSIMKIRKINAARREIALLQR